MPYTREKQCHPAIVTIDSKHYHPEGYLARPHHPRRPVLVQSRRSRKGFDFWVFYLLNPQMLEVFPLAVPPGLAGLYLLKNSRTSQIYVGSTTNLRQRWASWQHERGPIEHSDPEEWDFCVLKVTPELGIKALRRLEKEVIQKIKNESPEKLLNNHHGNGSTRLSRAVVYNDDDEAIQYKAACAVLHLRYNALLARVSALRRKGFTRITLHDLRQPGVFSAEGALPHPSRIDTLLAPP